MYGLWVVLAAIAVPLPAAPQLPRVPGAAPFVSLDDIRFAGWSKTALSFLDRPPHFLTRAELLAFPIPPPPSNGSPETRKELDTLLEWQARRTPAQQRSIVDHRDYRGVCDAIMRAAHASSRAVPRTRALLAHVEEDASFAVFHAKQRFNRARPHQLEPRLRPCLPVPGHPAYPSGHALQGYLIARVLSVIAPESQEALVAAGVLIGHEREIAGLHYPSDAVASRALGEALFARLETNEAFEAEVNAARAEWRRGSAPGRDAAPGPPRPAPHFEEPGGLRK